MNERYMPILWDVIIRFMYKESAKPKVPITIRNCLLNGRELGTQNLHLYVN